MERCDKLILLHLLMKDPSILTEGILTSGMFYRLKVTSQMVADKCSDTMPHFEKRVPISQNNASSVYLLHHVPKYKLPKMIYKSYAWGWQQMLQAIGVVMERGFLPTESRVLAELNNSDWHYNSYFRNNGGCLLYALIALVETARDQSWAEGDGSFKEVHRETLEEIPALKVLDDDFLFVHHFLVSFCVSPNATLVDPYIKILRSVGVQAAISGSSGDNKRSADKSPVQKKRNKSMSQ